MHKEGFINIILLVGIVAVIGAGIYFWQMHEPAQKGIPPQVSAKYKEMARDSYFSFFATLAFCRTDQGEEVYMVSGSTGYTGTGFYYSKDGMEIGSYFATDALTPDRPKPIVEISSYDQCTV